MTRRRMLRRIAYVRRNRCSALVGALCFFILLNPMLAGSAIGGSMLGVALFVVLVLAVWALRLERPVLWGIGVFGFITVDALIADRMGYRGLRPIALGATAIFVGAVTIALLRYVLDRRPITTDKVFGAVAAYILIALSFASLFGFLQIFQADAFTAAIAHGPDGKLNWSDLMYFSFTVLTSTGFGEITPATPMARSLIVIEQVLGVMYVAFLIARLANLYGSPKFRR
jgi:hypothetical protein